MKRISHNRDDANHCYAEGIAFLPPSPKATNPATQIINRHSGQNKYNRISGPAKGKMLAYFDTEDKQY